MVRLLFIYFDRIVCLILKFQVEFILGPFPTIQILVVVPITGFGMKFVMNVQLVGPNFP